MNESGVSSVDSFEKCPKCGGTLNRGYVTTAGLWWDYEKHPLGGGGERLSKFPALTNTSFPALRCWNCHIIIFDNEKKE
jgi:predicted nucleic-acid-binding Zn-ribbon protein